MQATTVRRRDPLKVRPLNPIAPNQAYTLDEISFDPAPLSTVSRRDVKLKSRITRNVSARLPILGAAMQSTINIKNAVELARYGGVPVIHRNATRAERLRWCMELAAKGILFAMAIGGDDADFVRDLEKAGCRLFDYDEASCNTMWAFEQLQEIRQQRQIADLISGNYTGARLAQIHADADVTDALKVGYGPGDTCWSRLITGGGVPQATATWNVAQVGHAYDLPVIIDGGIHCTGQMIHGGFMGGESFMLGTWLTKTKSCPYPVWRVNPRTGKKELYAEHFGMGSARVIRDRQANSRYSANTKPIPEGDEGLVGPITRTLRQAVLEDIAGGLRAGLALAGVKTIPELYAGGSDEHSRAMYDLLWFQTTSGIQEGKPHLHHDR